MGVTTQADRVEAFTKAFDGICRHVHQAVQGGDEVVRLVVTAFLSSGHLLIEDVPGVGKTTLAKALAATVGGTFGRIQFTPDLMPSDVVGTAIWDQSTNSFGFRPGPIFANVLLADEINRASPKTQSALLESMAEEQVTVDGTTYPLPEPFGVIATQNPLEHRGTFALPESQLDRFTMKVSMGYPSKDDELALVMGESRAKVVENLRPLMSIEAVRSMIGHAAAVHIAAAVATYIVDLARATREHPSVSLGMSPRAVLSLSATSKVWAASQGRPWVSPDDVQALFAPVVGHRLVLEPGSSVSASVVLSEILQRVAPPRSSRS